MQFILSEEEYNKLIKKERIKVPIDDFIKSMERALLNKGVYGVDKTDPFFEDFRTNLQTLRIKLDL